MAQVYNTLREQATDLSNDEIDLRAEMVESYLYSIGSSGLRLASKDLMILQYKKENPIDFICYILASCPTCYNRVHYSQRNQPCEECR